MGYWDGNLSLLLTRQTPSCSGPQTVRFFFKKQMIICVQRLLFAYKKSTMRGQRHVTDRPRAFLSPGKDDLHNLQRNMRLPEVK